MKKFLLPILLTASLSSFAGNEKGNGGGSFVCLDANGKILSAVSQDLWEATMEQREVIAVAGDEVSIAYAAIEKLRPINERFYHHVKWHLDRVIAKKLILKVKLPFTFDDEREIELYECEQGRAEFAQAAAYHDTGKIIFAKPIWDKLAPIDRATLLVHEAVYALMRIGYEHKDSKISRQIVAHLMTTSTELASSKLVPQGCRKYEQNECESKIRFEVRGQDKTERSRWLVEASGGKSKVYDLGRTNGEKVLQSREVSGDIYVALDIQFWFVKGGKAQWKVIVDDEVISNLWCSAGKNDDIASCVSKINLNEPFDPWNSALEGRVILE